MCVSRFRPLFKGGRALSKAACKRVKESCEDRNIRVQFPTDQEHRAQPEPRRHPDEIRSLLAASAYLVFFLPLLIDREDPLVRYHARQGLGLVFLWLAAWGLHEVCINAGVSLFGWIGYAGCLILLTLGIYRALGRETMPLPYFGRWFARIPLWQN